MTQRVHCDRCGVKLDPFSSSNPTGYHSITLCAAKYDFCTKCYMPILEKVKEMMSE